MTPTFAEFYRTTYADMVRLAFLLTGSIETARDLVQDSYLRVHGAWDRVTEPRPYLRRAVVNACNSHHRRDTAAASARRVDACRVRRARSRRDGRRHRRAPVPPARRDRLAVLARLHRSRDRGRARVPARNGRLPDPPRARRTPKGDPVTEYDDRIRRALDAQAARVQAEPDPDGAHRPHLRVANGGARARCRRRSCSRCSQVRPSDSSRSRGRRRQERRTSTRRTTAAGRRRRHARVAGCAPDPAAGGRQQWLR